MKTLHDAHNHILQHLEWCVASSCFFVGQQPRHRGWMHEWWCMDALVCGTPSRIWCLQDFFRTQMNNLRCILRIPVFGLMLWIVLLRCFLMYYYAASINGVWDLDIICSVDAHVGDRSLSFASHLRMLLHVYQFWIHNTAHFAVKVIFLYV